MPVGYHDMFVLPCRCGATWRIPLSQALASPSKCPGCLVTLMNGAKDNEEGGKKMMHWTNRVPEKCNSPVAIFCRMPCLLGWCWASSGTAMRK